MKTLRDLRASLRRELCSPERYVAARLEVVTPDGAPVFAVGGCWDRVEQRYVDREAPARVVKLQPSQVEMGRALGRYLAQRRADDPRRPALLLAIGNRGSGKTWLLSLLTLALALALPGCWQMGISLSSKQSRELRSAIAEIGAPGWVTDDVADFRDARTRLVTGSTVLWLSSRNPRSIRQALLKFEHVLVNEGQDMPEAVFVNAIGAVRSGGVLSIAANPPQTEAGDWVAELAQQLEHQDASDPDGLAFVLEADENQAIDQATRAKGARILRQVSPEAFAADAEGRIKLAGDLGYPAFVSAPLERGGHVGLPPDLGWTDVTRALSAAAVGGSVGFDYVAGADFQRTPGSCAAVAKLYRDQAGKLVLYVCQFVTTEGVEEDLSQALVSAGYYPGQQDLDGKPVASMMLVGDATGARQNAEHRKRDPYSYSRLRADGWTVIPPEWHWKHRTPWNPLVRDSRAQMHALLEAHQVVLSPRCAEPAEAFPSLVDSFRRAKVTPAGKFEKKGHHTHGPDGVRYLAWRFLPRPKPITTPTKFNSDVFELLSKVRWGLGS